MKNSTIVFASLFSAIILIIGLIGIAQIGSAQPHLTNQVGSLGETYLLKANVYEDQIEGRNLTDIVNKVTGEIVCEGLALRDICDIGDLSLNVRDIFVSNTDKYVTFTSNGRFRYVLEDLSGNRIILPVENELDFPKSEHVFWIMHRRDDGPDWNGGEIIDFVVASWLDGEVSLAFSEDFGEKHGFNFRQDGSYSIELIADLKDGQASIGVLYGDGEKFLGVGENSNERLAVSDSRRLTFYDKKDGSNFHGEFLLSLLR